MQDGDGNGNGETAGAAGVGNRMYCTSRRGRYVMEGEVSAQ